MTNEQAARQLVYQALVEAEAGLHDISPLITANKIIDSLAGVGLIAEDDS